MITHDVAGPAGTLRVEQHGEAGSALVVIPGITSPAATWRFVAEPLAAAGRRVFVTDLRGRGHSDPGPRGGYTLDDYAADALAVLDGLGLVRPAVLGHSLGGRIAAALALAAPGRVGPLVVAEPPLTGPGRLPYPIPLSFYTDAIEQARAGLTLEQARALEPDWTDEQVLQRAEWLPTCDVAAVTETYERFHDEDFHGLWERLPAPVLVHGTDSPVVSADGVAELLRRNPAAIAFAVEGAGHMIPWSALGRFLDVVADALDRGATGPGWVAG